MSSTFTKKRLDLTITLGAGAFGEEVGDTVTLTGLRMTADMMSSTGESMAILQLRVYGLAQEMMNRLTNIGWLQNAIPGKNKMALAAGDVENGMKLVFEGTIDTAFADYNSAPEVAFNVIAYAGLDSLVRPVGASSFKGAANVSTIMAGFAKAMGLAFEDNGVKVQLSNPYFPGTALTQVRACARAANIQYAIDRGVLAIWPKDGKRQGSMPFISPETGLVGYPAVSSSGLAVQTYFRWDIQHGGDVEIDSSLPMAKGIFHVSQFSHHLSSEMPGGPWFTNFQCSQASSRTQ